MRAPLIISEILSALRALSQVADLLRDLNSEIKNLNLTIEQKQIETFKKEVNEKLVQIQAATDDVSRKHLIVELSKQLSK